MLSGCDIPGVLFRDEPGAARGCVCSVENCSTMAAHAETIGYDLFERIDIRVATVVAAEPFPQARKPALKLTLDFGADLGLRHSSAQIVANYSPHDMVGKRVLAVVNFAPKRIAGFESQVLVLGLDDAVGNVVLATFDRDVPNGARLY